jgi:transposase
MELSSFYKQILNLGEHWTVADARLEEAKGQVIITAEHKRGGYVCPVCGKSAKLHDHAPERQWRHLDTCQLQTYIRCSLPRIRCEEHKVKTMHAPWAEPHGRFTLFFEAFCIELLLACQKKSKVCDLMNLSFDELYHIQSRAVIRGLQRRTNEPLERVGIDEKSMKRRHHYLSVLTDVENGRVLEVVEHRTEESAKTLLEKGLCEEQRAKIRSVSMDMWQAYENAVKAVLPGVDIVFDRFHVSQHLNKAVDQTRRAEFRELSRKDRAEAEELKGSRYLFLWNRDRIPENRYVDFIAAKEIARKTGNVWECKEVFRSFWSHDNVRTGRVFLENWIEHAKKLRIPALTKVADMLTRKAYGVLNYLVHRTTNAAAESLNSKIQQLKSNARGFRAFENYRTNILFFFGGLSMLPLKSQ